jgi:hypothetical protein
MYKGKKLEAAEARGDEAAVGDNRAAGATATQNAVSAAVRLLSVCNSCMCHFGFAMSM